MGLWWKNIYATPPEDEERKVSFEGDPEALPKLWYPILWRYSQNWQLLRVSSRRPYRINFRSADGYCMQCRKLIDRELVAVRVGPEAVTFWAVSDANHQPLKIVDMNIVFPGKHRRDRRDMWQRQDSQRFDNQAEFV